MKEYNYTNDKGYHKKLTVEEQDGNYYFQIWSMDTGDLCGCGTATKEELQKFFNYYGIKG